MCSFHSRKTVLRGAVLRFVQVINAVRDLTDGKLSRIWCRDPLLQLSLALHGSIFRLPASKLRSSYLASAGMGMQALADRGMHRPLPCTKRSRFAQRTRKMSLTLQRRTCMSCDLCPTAPAWEDLQA